jgi:cytidylate kinase (EC 2.7.4.14)
MKKIIIAIDGFSSTGKSTLAKAVAKELNYTYIDSGAMYRAIGLYLIQRKISLTDHTSICRHLQYIQLSFENNEIYLNSKNVEHAIRQLEISAIVSTVAAIPCVREFAVREQQRLGQHKAIVMDGRDIGTTVFPNAELKIYLQADHDIRVQRRLTEHLAKGEQVTKDEINQNILHRDHIDSTREVSPLRRADDARILDNSQLTLQECVNQVISWAKIIIES